MVGIEKQDIKVRVRRQLTTAIATQRYYGAPVRRSVGAPNFSKQSCRVIGAFNYQVEN
jgi:hypothetical protein